MSSIRRHRIKVHVDGLVASAQNLADHELARLVDLPDTLHISTVEGRLQCRKIRDSVADAGQLFTTLPSIQLSRIQQHQRRGGSRLRLQVKHLTPPPRFAMLDDSVPDADWLNYVLARGKAGGLISHQDGIRGFARLFAELRRRLPGARILICAVTSERLEEFVHCLIELSEQPIPIVTFEAHTSAGVRCVAMNAQTYFSRNRYVPAPDEFSISGLEPYHIVFFIDPHESLGPRHNSKMRLALMAAGCHVLIGVIVHRRKTLKNELRSLKHYLGSDILTVYAEPRRRLSVWSFQNVLPAAADTDDPVELVRFAIVQNDKRNQLVARIAIELVEGRWPFSLPNDSYAGNESTICIVVFNSVHKQKIRQILRKSGFEISVMGWSRRAGKYVKIFSLAEFDCLKQLPSHCIVNADGRGHPLQFRAQLLLRSRRDVGDINLIEIADFSENLPFNWRKKYPQATCVKEVTLRPGGFRRRRRR